MIEITDYFGLDLGDGESAVAWLREGATAPPMLLELMGRKSVLTVLGESGGTALIGEPALIMDAERLYARFKRRYLRERAVAGRLILKFAEGVRAQLERAGKLTDPARTLTFVGCPSGWPEEARAAYRRLFEQAGFHNVSVISESRAAFLYARESGELGLSDQALARPALVIDAGSSTTDFTFIDRLTARPAVDFGENALGGGLIDRMLLRRNVARHPKRDGIVAIFKACPQYAALAELEARKVKEMYFTRRAQAGEGGYPLPCESSVKLYYDDPPVTLDIRADDADMYAVLNQPIESLGGQSYLSAYRAALERAQAQLADAPPELIMLTGGASRMDFMAEMAQRAFPRARLVIGVEPEFAIARGLCYALRVDRRTERFEEDVRALIDSDAVEEAVRAALPRLMRALAPAIAEEIVARCGPDAFARWRSGERRAIGDIGGAMTDALKRSLEDGPLGRAAQEVTERWIEGLRPVLEELTDPICARSQLPPASLRLPGGAPEAIGGLDVGHVPLLNLDWVQAVVDVVAASLVAALLGGGGVALVMAGPMGLVVGFAVGLIASRMGTTLAKKHLDKFVMPAFMRTLFTRRAFEKTLEKRRGEIEGSAYAQLKAQLEAPDESAKQMVDRIAQAIETQLGGMARQARLMIH
ncbi:MAG: hypothetical protein VB065_10840 [Eubacteriales bacterium]|nr:hypothetical protein [Eubacteriales bacterium]